MVKTSNDPGIELTWTFLYAIQSLSC